MSKLISQFEFESTASLEEVVEVLKKELGASFTTSEVGSDNDHEYIISHYDKLEINISRNFIQEDVAEYSISDYDITLKEYEWNLAYKPRQFQIIFWEDAISTKHFDIIEKVKSAIELNIADTSKQK